MKPALRKADLESALGQLFQFRQKPPPETISTGIAEVDAAMGGIPRGSITEICGPASSGRTSLLLAVLAEATGREEVCALVDMADTFDPASGAAAGIDLSRLLWVRCGGNPEHALKAADLLAHGGGFGILALDLADLSPQDARRIPLPCWYRLLRAIEKTSTALVVVGQETNAKSCAALILEMHQERVAWTGLLLRGARVQVERRKPGRAAATTFEIEGLRD